MNKLSLVHDASQEAFDEKKVSQISVSPKKDYIYRNVTNFHTNNDSVSTPLSFKCMNNEYKTGYINKVSITVFPYKNNISRCFKVNIDNTIQSQIEGTGIKKSKGFEVITAEKNP